MQYTYDGAGNILRAAGEGIDIAFTYDAQGRVAQLSYKDHRERTYQYSYDAGGHLSSGTLTGEYRSTASVLQRIVDHYTYVCDDQGRVIKEIIQHEDAQFPSGSTDSVYFPIDAAPTETYWYYYGDYYLYLASEQNIQ